MGHDEMQLQLDAYLDGELAPRDARELKLHLERCPDCASMHDARVSLGAAIRRELPGLRAPDDLRSGVMNAVRAAAGGRAVPGVAPSTWRRLALAAGVVLAAFGGWGLGVRRAADSALLEQVLASHVRSLMPGHLTDVVSSDQHTVKPWFNGKLDYSPAVYDFAGRGYPLIGGRLDYLSGRPVAVLVYQRRRHLINVYLWPTEAAAAGERAIITRQGYHMLHWNLDGYAYWAVSDLGTAELTQFAGLLRQADSASGGYHP